MGDLAFLKQEEWIEEWEQKGGWGEGLEGEEGGETMANEWINEFLKRKNKRTD